MSNRHDGVNGVAESNAFNVHGSTGRTVATLMGTLACIAVALTGMISHFIDFMYITGLWLPPIVGVMFVDFYLLGNEPTGPYTGKKRDNAAYSPKLRLMRGVPHTQ